ncbi:NUDIX hydrolase [Halobaculum sp. D14]|uniref:NUDIX hydrolase n=1 Tax=unclassified Halobaculum TaxID=2640896 RepID=UPI003EBE7DBD
MTGSDAAGDRPDDPDDADGPDDGLAWETLDSGVDYACPGFDVRVDDVRLPDGTEGEYHYVDEPGAVVVLPFTADGAADESGDGRSDEVVLIEEWRQAVGRVNRGLPAGSLEGDEEPAAAARRELREETGYEAGAVEHLASVEPSNGVSNSVHHHFVASGCTPTASTDFDDDESIRPVAADYDDFRDAVFAGDVRDGRAVIAVSQYEAGAHRDD